MSVGKGRGANLTRSYMTAGEEGSRGKGYMEEKDTGKKEIKEIGRKDTGKVVMWEKGTTTMGTMIKKGQRGKGGRGKKETVIKS